MRNPVNLRKSHKPSALSREFAFYKNMPLCCLCKVRCASLEAHYKNVHPELYAVRKK
jgi:hypothetical protein